MSSILKLGCIQMTATPDAAANLAQAEVLIDEAAAAGLDMVALPEAFDFLAPDPAAIPDYAKPVEDHLALRRIGELARKHALWILAGSVSTRAADGAVVNRTVLFAANGAIAAYYDKIHLFDVDLPNGDPIRESDLYRAGDRAVVTDTPWGGLGLSICYDMRFPHLYRNLAQQGARLLAVPAAFSSYTGPLHWHVLLRARAIETGCFVIAPAQCGDNHESRRSYGHSLIIDPWGRIMTEGGDEPGVISATLDLGEVERFRAAIPSLFNDRVPARKDQS